jgi:hypothetical protein
LLLSLLYNETNHGFTPSPLLAEFTLQAAYKIDDPKGKKQSIMMLSLFLPNGPTNKEHLTAIIPSFYTCWFFKNERIILLVTLSWNMRKIARWYAVNRAKAAQRKTESVIEFIYCKLTGGIGSLF